MFKSERTLWILFGILWGSAILAGIENVRRGENPVLRYSGQGSYGPYLFFILIYVVGGIVLAIMHSKLVEKYPGSSFTKHETAEGTRYDTVPAKKFFAMWPTGAIGIIFVLSLPYAIFGYGIGQFFCWGFGGLLILMAFVPKLWRRGTPHTFTISRETVHTGARTLAVAADSMFVIGNTLRYKPYKVPAQIDAQMGNDLRNNIYYAPGGNPLAAQGLGGVHDTGVGITNAIGNGLGEMAHRYYVEMRARSWQLKLKTAGKEHVLADGLDGGTAQTLLDEAAALTNNAKTK